MGLGAAMTLKVMTFPQAFSAMASPIPWLIAIAFFFAKGFIKTGLGNRISYLFVRAFGKTTLGLCYSLVFAEALLAPAIPSLAARAGGIMKPLVESLSIACGSKPDNGTEKKMGAYLMATMFQTSCISSAMFLTAMAANPLAANLAEAATGQVISWVGWATAALSALVFKWLRMAHHEEGDTHLREAALFWCFSYLSFVVAEVAQLSGIVSTLFAGIFMARYVTPNLTRRGLRLCAQLYRVLALLADTMVFLLVGMAIVVYYNECEVSHTSFFLVAFVGCIGARAANIFPLARLLNHLRPRSKHKISKNFQVVMWFSGLRGAIAVALSVQMPGPRKGPIIVVTMLIVFASIFVFGGASKRLRC